MKKQILVVFLFSLSYLVQSQSTVYHPLPETNGIWRESFAGEWDRPCTDFQDYLSGDTTVNGSVYHKIYRTGVEYYLDQYGVCHFDSISRHFSHEYHGAYRNDSINKRVFYLSYNYPYDTCLLYDFNLNLNDTLPETCLYSLGGHVLRISAIDSFPFGDNYHKRFTISDGNIPTPWGYLIEGIGYTTGLLEHCTVPMLSTLNCFMQDSVTIYPMAGAQCDLVTGMENNIIENVHFRMFPTPVTTFAEIRFNPDVQSVNLLIYDVFGIERLGFYDLRNGERINLPMLTTGMYIYRLSDGVNSISTGRFVKM